MKTVVAVLLLATVGLCSLSPSLPISYPLSHPPPPLHIFLSLDSCFHSLCFTNKHTASAITSEQLYDKYVAWSARYNKQHDAHEHIQRFENFKANYHLVRHLNRQNRGYFALNEFADLSQEEFEARYLRPIVVPNRKLFKEFNGFCALLSLYFI